jgi:phosphoglycerate dehydrogenase-like enzyme
LLLIAETCQSENPHEPMTGPTPNQYTIWTNARLPNAATDILSRGIAPHRLVLASQMSTLNLVGSPPDQLLESADIAFGQPEAKQVMELPNLRWIHLTTAGYTSYDRQDVRQALLARGAALTTSSGVYDEPCAQHVLAMMMAFARGLPQSLTAQLQDRSWPAAVRRSNSFLLNGQTALLCGFGEIARKLSRLLSPFDMNLIGVRRKIRGDEPIRMISEDQIDDYLPHADHVINVLPANESTFEFFNAKRFARLKQGAYFYSIGRGNTVDQPALIEALQVSRLAAAYLDVMTPEPLPPDHVLWRMPNCFITPHTAGGDRAEMENLANHFLENFHRYQSGAPLLNRVM